MNSLDRRYRVQGSGCMAAAALLFCAALLPPSGFEDLPKPTDYVSDLAHVLSPDAIARIDSICSQLDHYEANAQIAVVTVHNLDGDDAADYASQPGRQVAHGQEGLGPRRADAAGRERSQVPHRRGLRPGRHPARRQSGRHWPRDGVLPRAKAITTTPSSVPSARSGK